MPDERVAMSVRARIAVGGFAVLGIAATIMLDWLLVMVAAMGILVLLVVLSVKAGRRA